MDIVTVFLNFGINITVYIQLPIGYYRDINKIALFLKTLYKLKQFTCQSASLLGVVLKKANLKPLYLDFFIYVYNFKTAKIVIVAIYVDNILIIGSDIDKINVLKK